MINIPATANEARQQVQKSHKTLTEARNWVADTRAEMARSTYVKPAKDTVADVAERWLAARERDVKAGTLRTVSVEGYRSALTGVNLHIGTLLVQKVTTTDVRHLLVTLATDGGGRGKPLSHRSVIYALTSLRLVLDYAVESGLIQKNPADAVKTPKKPVEDEPEQITTWDRDQLVSFRHHLAALVPGTMAALRALWLLQGRPDGDSLVICDAVGDLVHPDAFSARFDKLIADAGLPHLTEIHHVRHSLARALHKANFKPIEGASVLGHSLATHLQHYLPTGDEYVRGAEERMRALFADAV
ncbi:hypothetical protein [Nocardioides sp. NPDC047086]|uniref:site-specific integrase n=1 Tax=Nocardioides sp. NPDC047086 TaxID=3154810 RepID=UPI0033F93901